MSLLKELRSYGRRLDRVQLEVAPPTLRMVVCDLNDGSRTSYPDEGPLDSDGKLIIDEWSMLIAIDKKPENLK